MSICGLHLGMSVLCAWNFETLCFVLRTLNFELVLFEFPELKVQSTKLKPQPSASVEQFPVAEIIPRLDCSQSLVVSHIAA